MISGNCRRVLEPQSQPYFYLFRHQDTLKYPRKSRTIFDNVIIGNLKIFEIMFLREKMGTESHADPLFSGNLEYGIVIFLKTCNGNVVAWDIFPRNMKCGV